MLNDQVESHLPLDLHLDSVAVVKLLVAMMLLQELFQTPTHKHQNHVLRQHESYTFGRMDSVLRMDLFDASRILNMLLIWQ